MNSRSSSENEVPNLRTRIRQATDDAILKAAEEVFAEQGLDGARMNDIAARAGVAVGTLYNHFKDRDALLAGLLDLRKEEILVELDAGLDAPAGDFHERVLGVFYRFFAYVEQHRPFYAIMAEAENRGGAPKKPEMLREIYSRMERLVKRGIKEKALRPSGAELYPSLLMGIIRAAVIRDRLTGARTPLPVEELVGFFFDGAGHR